MRIPPDADATLTAWHHAFENFAGVGAVASGARERGITATRLLRGARHMGVKHTDGTPTNTTQCTDMSHGCKHGEVQPRPEATNEER